MLTSLGERGPNYSIPAIYLTGLLVGALASAVALWVASGIGRLVPADARGPIVIAFCALALLRDFGLVNVNLPENRRLVPQDVFGRGMRPAALRFGVEMGSGVRTFVPSTTPYVLIAAALLLAPSAADIVVIAAGFALGRGLVPIARESARDPLQWDRQLHLATPVLIRGTAVLGALGAVLLA